MRARAAEVGTVEPPPPPQGLHPSARAAACPASAAAEVSTAWQKKKQ